MKRGMGSLLDDFRTCSRVGDSISIRVVSRDFVDPFSRSSRVGVRAYAIYSPDI